MDGADEAIGWTGPEPKPTRVQKGVGGQRWLTLVWPTETGAVPPRNGCGLPEHDARGAGVDLQRQASYHSSGPPMLAHRGDWQEWLVDAWSETTNRLHQDYKKYFVDMLSYTLANIHHRKRELIVNNLELTKPDLYELGDAVKKMVEDVDPCTAPLDQVLRILGLAYFVHYTHYM